MSDAPTSQAAYREDSLGPGRRLADLTRAYERTVAELPGPLVAAYAGRVARIAFGLVTLGGGVAMFVTALLDGLARRPDALWRPTPVLLATWVVAVTVYFLTRLVARWRVPAGLLRAVRPGGDVHADIARLRGRHAAADLGAAAARREFASIALPLCGLGLIGPLSLHFIAGLVFFQCSLSDFDKWIFVSGLLTGLAHLALLVFAVDFADKVRAVSGHVPVLSGTPWKQVFWVILVSAIPGILFILPVLITALTGVVYGPLAYGWIGRSIDRERAAVLAGAPDPAP